MDKIKFESIFFSRVSEHIERKIAEYILDGKLKAGDRLPTEKEMARQFGVSLVTLREALRALQIFGLIEKKKGQGGGVFVSEAKRESIKTALGYFLRLNYLSPKHLYDVRKIIEPPVVRLAAQEITVDEIKTLEKNIAYCEERLRETKGRFGKKEFWELDKEHVNFHRLIAESTHNPILGLTIDYVFDFLSLCEKDLLVADFQYAANNVKDHKKILGCLKERDEKSCEREMVRHLRALDEYLRGIQKGPVHERIPWIARVIRRGGNSPF